MPLHLTPIHTRRSQPTLCSMRAGARQTPEVLLIQRGHPPFEGQWALPGGFVEYEEPLETAARRELEEETSLRPRSLNQLAAFGNPGRDPRGWTVSVVFWAWVDQPRLLPNSRGTNERHRLPVVATYGPAVAGLRQPPKFCKL
jgi:ADP-ribose pyrophosphatase YjhB (NUDIX family)